MDIINSDRNMFNSDFGWFAFIISIVGLLSLCMVVGSSENWKPRFLRMGHIHWNILVYK